MQKAITIFFLFLYVPSLLIAQEQYLNVNAGVNIANMQFSPKAIFEDNRIRILTEVNYEMIYRKNISISVGLNYVQRGFRDPLFFTDDLGMQINFNDFANLWTYDYVGMPIKIGYRVKGKVSFTPRIGLIPSQLVKAKLHIPMFTFESGMLELDKYDEIAIEGSVNKFDIVPIFELETAYTIKNRIQLNVLLLFQHGLVEVNKNEFFETKPNRHIGIGVQLGCKYDISEM